MASQRVAQKLVSRETGASLASTIKTCHACHILHNLDLLWANTLIFAQTGYSIYVLRQASRRSWRIGQKRAVKVKFLAYADSMQESCLRLMGKKLLVSLAMEGKFSTDGLQALEEDDDMLTAMARELVTQKGIGEKADEVWRRLQVERVRSLDQGTPAAVEPERRLVIDPEEEVSAPAIEIPPAVVAPGLLQFGMVTRPSARRPASADENQLSLGF